ncbi:MAG: helix-turn-helix transcriptional regulator [Bacteroidales bacterium]|nr:helix-turn-helix transcriptional regulator [Bacteroidales bacterium]MCF8388189.1 helix-turn-helix transcriptional regulator [Bacteroidales bacterium]
MNSKVAIFFTVLLIVHLGFAIFLFLISKIHHRKELSYMYWSLFLKAVLALGPSLLMFNLDIPWSAYLTGSVKVTLIPLTYLYLLKLSKENKRITKNDLWHFAPLALSIVLTLIVVPGHAGEIAGQADKTLKSTMKMVWENNWHHNILAITCRIISFGQAILYSVLAYFLYRKYLKVLKNNISVFSHYNTLWIKWVVVLLLLQGFFEGFPLLGIYNFGFVLVIGFVFQLFFAFFFVIHATTQKDLAPLFKKESESNPDNTYNKKVKSIIESFKDKELYLNPEISLEETARQLYLTKTRLTQIIKDAGFDNFYCFINIYRIEESKRLLSFMPEHHVIESVIEQSGFKSRSTFYRVFRQITGITPSEYLKVHKIK